MKSCWRLLGISANKFSVSVYWWLSAANRDEILATIRCLDGITAVTRVSDFLFNVEINSTAGRDELMQKVGEIEGVATLSRASHGLTLANI